MFNGSFIFLTNAGNFFLNEAAIIMNKCIFMNGIERKIQRKISNKYVFLKSINVLSPEILYGINGYQCDLAFHFLQFEIHLSLKTDYDYEVFHENCKDVLIKGNNLILSNKKKCAFTDENEAYNFILNKNLSIVSLERTLSSYLFFASMALLIMLLMPVIFIIYVEIFYCEPERFI